MVLVYVCFLAKSLRAAPFILKSVLVCTINYSHSSQHSSEFTRGTETELWMYHMHEICPGGNRLSMAGCVCVVGGGGSEQGTLIHQHYCGMVLCSKARSQEHISPLFIQPITESYSHEYSKNLLTLRKVKKNTGCFCLWVQECMGFQKNNSPHNTINFLYVVNTSAVVI